MNSPLLAQIQNYHPTDQHEAAMAMRLQQFLEANGPRDPFVRELTGQVPEWGHVTGSAWIVTPDYTQCLMLHHAKLGKWVQPGGHCDGETNVLEVAAREANEETGLQVTALSQDIFDIDIHVIPEYWNTPQHLHFDVRYLFTANPRQPLISNHESRGVRWVTLEEAIQLSDEETVARMVRKTRELQRNN